MNTTNDEQTQLTREVEAFLREIEARWDAVEPIAEYEPVPAHEIWDAVM